MPQTVVKGKPFDYHVGSKKTRINGPKGTIIVLNSDISNNCEVTPGKLQSYIRKEILEVSKANN